MNHIWVLLTVDLSNSNLQIYVGQKVKFVILSPMKFCLEFVHPRVLSVDSILPACKEIWDGFKTVKAISLLTCTFLISIPCKLLPTCTSVLTVYEAFCNTGRSTLSAILLNNNPTKGSNFYTYCYLFISLQFVVLIHKFYVFCFLLHNFLSKSLHLQRTMS